MCLPIGQGSRGNEMDGGEGLGETAEILKLAPKRATLFGAVKQLTLDMLGPYAAERLRRYHMIVPQRRAAMIGTCGLPRYLVDVIKLVWAWPPMELVCDHYNLQYKTDDVPLLEYSIGKTQGLAPYLSACEA